MEITVADQTWNFLLSIGLGALLGVCYDIFRILRVAWKHSSAAILVEDILFSIFCAFVSFGFMLAVDCGQIRMFVLIGELIGFALYYCTLGVLVLGVSKRIIAAIRWIANFIWRYFLAPIIAFLKWCYGFFTKITDSMAKYLKKTVKNSNMHLKKHSKLLYNLKKRLQRKRQKKTLEG